MELLVLSSCSPSFLFAPYTTLRSHLRATFSEGHKLDLVSIPRNAPLTIFLLALPIGGILSSTGILGLLVNPLALKACSIVTAFSLCTLSGAILLDIHQSLYRSSTCNVAHTGWSLWVYNACISSCWYHSGLLNLLSSRCTMVTCSHTVPIRFTHAISPLRCPA